jgi:choline dehydrogenase-like flavoprotein
MGRRPPEPQLDADALRPFFWQFARSRIDRLDVMRFGPEFMREDAANVRTLLNATVTRILTNDTGNKFAGVEVACLEGVRARVRGKVCVLAASGVENARLLMASNQICQAGIGNHHDVVGRFLLDHPSARLGRYDAADASRIVDRFGFYGLSQAGQTHMYMHGLALPRSVQEKEGLLNCALYILEERAPDDPLEALKRLLARKSSAIGADLSSLARSPGLLAKGVGMKALQGSLLPERVKTTVVNAAIKLNPNLVAREHLNRGIPHKLTGLIVEGISEQRPDPDSRITLSETKDELGVARAKINWKIDRDARRSLARLGQQMAREFDRVGLPLPTLDAWVEQNSLDDAAIIDMAHTMGTTRMADDPKQGVVDRNCRVHGVGGLYVAGASVFPTGGHANPTLMILALAIRLSDHLKHSAAAGQ